MATLNRFRIVRLPLELQKGMDLPELLCADPEGLPFPEGQAFYRWVIDENACEPATAYNYLSVVLPFLTFLSEGTPSLRYTAPVERIRYRLRDYLKERLGCMVRPHRNGNFMVKSSQTITAASVRLFLTALKRFYTFAILEGGYTDPNPLVWTTERAMPDRDFIPKMPPQSGMTLPKGKTGRVPDTYFCIVSGDWRPRIIDDPNLPKVLLAAFTHPRDRLITRILFESGARVSEVLGLTLGDWRRCGQRERALTTNKGSGGARVKEIWWSSATSQLLRNYLTHERQRRAQAVARWEDWPDSARLFVTEAGEPYTYAAFYANWQKACQRAKLKITPHQARHWFVTLALHKFETLPPEKRDAARQALMAYMGWHNSETIKAYDHHLRALDFAPSHAALVRLVEMGTNGTATLHAPDDTPSAEPMTSPEMRDWLGRLLESA